MKKLTIATALMSVMAGNAHALRVEPMEFPHSTQYTIVIKENGREEMRSVLLTLDGKETVASVTNVASFLQSSGGTLSVQDKVETGYYVKLTPTLGREDGTITTQFIFEKRDLANGEHSKSRDSTGPKIQTVRIDNNFALRDGETLTYRMDQSSELQLPTITRTEESVPGTERFISITARKI